jgi:ABC-type phosphate transport system substrate-binding protein
VQRHLRRATSLIGPLLDFYDLCAGDNKKKRMAISMTHLRRGGTRHSMAVALLAMLGCCVAVLAGGCNRSQDAASGGDGATTVTSSGGGNLSGEVRVDGSSTVFPLSEAYAEEFMRANPGVKVTVGSSGTGGGFKKFANKETDIGGASRPIKNSEAEACQKTGSSSSSCRSPMTGCRSS